MLPEIGPFCFFLPLIIRGAAVSKTLKNPASQRSCAHQIVEGKNSSERNEKEGEHKLIHGSPDFQLVEVEAEQTGRLRKGTGD